ncbi:protein anoxia up-regulated-like isoform X7 [Condylostylus longicornis]|uniref:protein anoxia up-regulated-like isoform X7 n=1 Tax=Condylostylus longicornis TaxID=2530218 RepID=UPI00244E05A5|nr:protein anoxia up-regulated-like isoform X7 [Condylostylus longicornis]
MVYTSDYYTTRSYSSRPVVSSYTVSTPRVYLTTERPGLHQSRNHEYSYSSTVESRSNSNDPLSNRTQRSTYTSERNASSGPGGYYSTERTSTTGAGPGGYSYSSTSSGRLPGGTSYRHYSYRV